MVGAPPEALRRVPLFADLTKREVEQIARRFKERRFAAGETVAREGSGGAAFFLIDTGEARVSIGGEERATLQAGDYFGEIALIDGGLRTASVTATSDGKAYGLTPWQFRPMLEEHAEVAWPLLEAMAARVRELENR
jgi:CRP-like cAMP-binding protein